MDLRRRRQSVVALTDEQLLSLSTVVDAMEELGIGGLKHNHTLFATQVSSLSKLPVAASSLDTVISISGTDEFPGGFCLGEILRVLKPGGTTVVYKTLQSTSGEMEKAISSLERQLLLAGFLEAQALQLESETVKFFGVKVRKPSWKIGSSFALKKPSKGLVKVQVDDHNDLIDEDSLLTEEDLKKPKMPVGDCEVGSTRKACKNCTCGRAEAEEKVKL